MEEELEKHLPEVKKAFPEYCVMIDKENGGYHIKSRSCKITLEAFLGCDVEMLRSCIHSMMSGK